MDHDAVRRAKDRLADAAEGRVQPADVDAALERARAQIEALAEATAQLESVIPAKVEGAVEDGLRAQVLPVARHLAEVRGLTNQVIRRLERIEGDQLSERNARVDDLALLVDLIASGWRSVEERLGRLEKAVHERGGAVVYRMEERRPPSAGSGSGS
jgi:hypothetical protein